MKEIMNHFLDALICIAIGLGFLLVVSLITWGIFKLFGTTPIEEINHINIDSITNINDSLKIKVESLDSIKNAKIIEVVALDNDSTIKLFFELVSE